MNITIIAIGKTKTRYIREGIEEYLKRAGRYVPVELVEIPDIKNAGRVSKEEQKNAEGTLILSKLTPADYVVLLDERGKEFTSEEYSSKLESILASGKKRMVMVIGGPYGFSKAVYDRANDMLALSKMTFNHEMVRMFLAEQLYRAMTILRGEPYHHS